MDLVNYAVKIKGEVSPFLHRSLEAYEEMPNSLSDFLFQPNRHGPRKDEYGRED